MKTDWIDNIINGLIEFAGSRNIHDIADSLNIRIQRLGKSNPILKNSDAAYFRYSKQGCEAIYVRNNLEKREAFTIAHEIGHAVMHTEIARAFYKQDAIRGRLEREADYFACRLLDIKIYPPECEGYTTSQISGIYGIREEAIEFAEGR